MGRMRAYKLFVAVAGLSGAWMPHLAAGADAAEIVNTTCAGCHSAGVLGAPRLGVPADWQQRRQAGIETLVSHAIEGLNAMPPRGGNANLSDEQVRGAVEHMLAQLDGQGQGGQASAPAGRAELVASLDRVIGAAKAPPADASAAAPPAREAEVVAAAKPAPSKSKSARPPVNTFNRLLKPPSKRNPPPTHDGIHDPGNDGTGILQAPKDAFGPLPKANSGNRVDWVKALASGDVQPRYDLNDPDKLPVVLDLNIVREVKGSMPDVVYPHKQHTEWLDCSNCHPAIFIPKKGANNISMASILLGEQCGVCHGKVAFPVAECRKCHSKNKPRN